MVEVEELLLFELDDLFPLLYLLLALVEVGQLQYGVMIALFRSLQFFLGNSDVLLQFHYPLVERLVFVLEFGDLVYQMDVLIFEATHQSLLFSDEIVLLVDFLLEVLLVLCLLLNLFVLPLMIFQGAFEQLKQLLVLGKGLLFFVSYVEVEDVIHKLVLQRREELLQFLLVLFI